uniref:Uncharacterized protein n=1 Tax=Onchocerca volvulus TaxID=6282 RepID=A0A8R1TKG8_ONCVO
MEIIPVSSNIDWSQKSSIAINDANWVIPNTPQILKQKFVDDSDYLFNTVLTNDDNEWSLSTSTVNL